MRHVVRRLFAFSAVVGASSVLLSREMQPRAYQARTELIFPFVVSFNCRLCCGSVHKHCHVALPPFLLVSLRLVAPGARGFVVL